MTTIYGVKPSIDTMARTKTAASVDPRPMRDESDNSIAARLAARAKGPDAVRMELVDRVRREIQAGTYETQERIDATVDRLLDELFPL
jgi:anti-sigma28 factor (negative regulator of flagellin synthesis)